MQLTPPFLLQTVSSGSQAGRTLQLGRDEHAVFSLQLHSSYPVFKNQSSSLLSAPSPCPLATTCPQKRHLLRPLPGHHLSVPIFGGQSILLQSRC